MLYYVRISTYAENIRRECLMLARLRGSVPCGSYIPVTEAQGAVLHLSSAVEQQGASTSPMKLIHGRIKVAPAGICILRTYVVPCIPWANGSNSKKSNLAPQIWTRLGWDKYRPFFTPDIQSARLVPRLKSCASRLLWAMQIIPVQANSGYYLPISSTTDRCHPPVIGSVTL